MPASVYEETPKKKTKLLSLHLGFDLEFTCLEFIMYTNSKRNNFERNLFSNIIANQF